MKKIQRITLLIAFAALLASCQTGTDVNKILSNQDTRMAIMDTIANDNNFSVEMMMAMMNNENGNMMMGNQGTIVKMMQNNPDMMQSMMTSMIEICNRDTLMMNSMCSSIMNNSQMMNIIHKNMNGNMDMSDMKH